MIQPWNILQWTILKKLLKMTITDMGVPNMPLHYASTAERPFAHKTLSFLFWIKTLTISEYILILQLTFLCQSLCSPMGEQTLCQISGKGYWSVTLLTELQKEIQSVEVCIMHRWRLMTSHHFWLRMFPLLVQNAKFIWYDPNMSGN